MNIVLCDDEKQCLVKLEQQIMNWTHSNAHVGGVIIRTFTSSEDLLAAWKRGMQIDALFLDIQIPGEMNGIALAKEIHQSNEYIPIVFVTNYGEYAEEGYIVNALRYLRKPIVEQAIADCMSIIWRRWEVQQDHYIIFDLSTQVLRIPADSILFIEVRGHYSIIRTADSNQEYRIKKPLESIRKQLPPTFLVQCHRSFIVNVKYIRHITGSSISLADGTSLQVGRIYQAELMKRFRQYYIEGA